MSPTPLSYEDAAAIVAAQAAEFARRPVPSERVALAAAVGRVLAEPILADRDLPPFPRSTRDGYAVRADEANRHESLRVAGTIRAGDKPIAEPIEAGTAWEIMTGAAVPAGADAVAMLEHIETRRDGASSDGASGDAIRLVPSRTLAAGENIVPRGAEARAGDELVQAGARLGAAQIAAAAACGYAEPCVHRRPRVLILATGDELVAVSAKPGPGEIRNSNSGMLASLVESAGAQPLIAPVVADTEEALNRAFYLTASADLVLFTGGVSAGRFDLVEPALRLRGAKFHFTGARIQPGRPVIFGELPSTAHGGASIPFFGLPGNPISAAATFLLFAAPVLAALAGQNGKLPRFALARLTRAVKGNSHLTRFVPAFCDAASVEVAAVGWQGSGDVAAFARSNCFVVIPEGTEQMEAGAIGKILPF